MVEYFSRRAVLGLVGGGVASPVFANAPSNSIFPEPRPSDYSTRSLPSVESLIDEARLGGKIGFVIADATTGEVIEVKNPLLSLPPASVAKAITAAYAMSELGSEHRFSTRLVATGPIEAGKIQGNLVLVGRGDPTLDTDALAAMAKELKKQGVTSISGEFKVSGAYLPYQRVIDPGQPDHLGYNPAISGLNLNYNRVHFEWKRDGDDYDVTMDARSETQRPPVKMARMEVIDRNVPIFTYRDMPGIDSWTVAQKALGKGGSRWLPVRRPDLYVGEVFQVLARGQGILLPRPKVSKEVPDDEALVEHRSAPLPDIVRKMLKYSTNLTAEVLGLATSVERGGAPATLAQSGAQMSGWAQENLGTTRFAFTDHSGLGDRSRVTARDMVQALLSLGPNGECRELLKTVNADPGALVKDAEVDYEIRAKTGTLNFVSSLAGYVSAPNGREFAFSVFTADMDRRAAIPRAMRERPKGARSWSRRSRRLQQQLIARWVMLYGS